MSAEPEKAKRQESRDWVLAIVIGTICTVVLAVLVVASISLITGHDTLNSIRANQKTGHEVLLQLKAEVAKENANAVGIEQVLTQVKLVVSEAANAGSALSAGQQQLITSLLRIEQTASAVCASTPKCTIPSGP